MIDPSQKSNIYFKICMMLKIADRLNVQDFILLIFD
jgi:hypothetical protein